LSREHSSDYEEATTARCERALVTLLGDVGPWRERIYLAGGLAPRYIVGQLPEGTRAHVGTTDVDLIIGLALGDATHVGRHRLPPSPEPGDDVVKLHRNKPLPELPAVGRLVVGESVVARTHALLRDAGKGSPPHEGLVWWLGRQVGPDTLILASHRPPSRSGPEYVFTDEVAAGTAARLARARRLGVVAQVHSHPGGDTRHSDGDDGLIFMPFEGMFSLVVGNYGADSMLPEDGAGLHQFQAGRWILVRQAESALIVVPAEVGS
jgi:proteasome lid subunit RPN8/RPN11